MQTFEDLNLSKTLLNAIQELGFESPTPIQTESFPVVMSGKDVVGIAQTGTGKTLAYMMPILQGLKFSKQTNPRVLVLVPTRELVLQVVERTEEFAKFINVRVLGVYGGTNINTQKALVAQGCDILVATPGRLYDLTIAKALQLKSITKLVIDEVDIMLDLGFRFQLSNIFDLLPKKRQNIMFSATMTEEVEELINSVFESPEKISIAVSGTPLDNIAQQRYDVVNFNTKANLLLHLLEDKSVFKKVLVFISHKKLADALFTLVQYRFGLDTCVVHSNKSQNYRIRSIEEFDQGVKRILIATDVMARGLDFDKVTHVINFDTPRYPENYMHRIGRTGRAAELGHALLFSTEKEQSSLQSIESLMDKSIEVLPFPEEVSINHSLIDEERSSGSKNHNRNNKAKTPEGGFHEKKEKNKKVNLGGSYKRKLAEQYKKPKTRGDKFANRKKK